MKKLIIAAAIVSTLSGCAENQQQVAARSFVQANSPMKFTKDQCEMKWQQTEYFISKYSPAKIQTSTPVSIQTYNLINPSLNIVTYSADAHRLNTSTGCSIEVNVNRFGGVDYIDVMNIMKDIKSS